MITSLYTALLIFIYIFLTVNVIRCRRKYRIPLLDQNNDELLRAIRVHANFIEYTPLFLIALFFAEQDVMNAYLIHVIGFLYVIGRISHAYGVLKIENYDPNHLSGFKFRTFGMVCTFLPLAVLSVFLLCYYFKMTF